LRQLRVPQRVVKRDFPFVGPEHSWRTDSCVLLAYSCLAQYRSSNARIAPDRSNAVNGCAHAPCADSIQP